jgi:hypothetical protein
MVGFSFFMMSATVILIGALLWFRDAFTPNLPTAFLATDVIWAASLVSLFFFWRYPWMTVLSAWILFTTLMILAWPFQPSHTPSAFIYNNCIQLTNVVFAHLGLYFQQKAKARPS